MNRTKLLLLFGGESSEHDVSLASARNVYAAIDGSEFDVEFCYIDRHGKWWLLDRFDDSGNHSGVPQLTPVLGSGCFLTIPGEKVVKPDVIFPVLHGVNGEDGSVQGLSQLLHIPCVGCDMAASAICMDKLATKEILARHDVPIVPYEVHRTGEDMPNFAALAERLGDPIFVKPTRAGSSVGVSKVHDQTELEAALELAHRLDDTALIERSAAARELEVAVLGNPPHHEVSGVGEIKSGAEFYDYAAKYSTDSKSEVVIPAVLDEGVTDRVRDLSYRIYQILGCRGLARIDFFIDNQGEVYLNELNTLPGFTNISMYPKLWRERGMHYPELVRRLISYALDGAE